MVQAIELPTRFIKDNPSRLKCTSPGVSPNPVPPMTAAFNFFMGRGPWNIATVRVIAMRRTLR